MATGLMNMTGVNRAWGIPSTHFSNADTVSAINQEKTMNELLLAIFKDIDTHINTVVDKRVAEILANHATLNTINEELYDKMSKIAQHEINLHEAEHMHHERSDIEEIAHDAMDNYDFSSACGEIVDDRIDSALDDILHDKIQEILNDTKFVITGGTITTEV